MHLRYDAQNHAAVLTASAAVKSLAERIIQRHPDAAIALPLSLALISRIVGIVSRPIWYDEAFSVLFAGKGVPAMLIGTLSPAGAGASDVHPLGYYSTLWAWMRVFGDSILSVRLLSVLASLGTVAVVYSLSLHVFDRRTAMVAGILAALSPFHVHYGQEIRMYAFLGLWLALATYCYWMGSHSPRREWWAGFAVFAAMGQYTHNLAAFYLLALALWPILSREWHVVRNVLLASIGAMLLYLPWLFHLPAQFAKVNQAYWIGAPGPHRILTLLLTFVTNLPLQPGQLTLGLFAALSITLFASFRAVASVTQHDLDSKRMLWMSYLALAPAALMVAFSQWKPVFIERALLPSGLAFCIWVARTLTQARVPPLARAVTVFLLSVGFSMGLYQHLTYDRFPYAPYVRMAQSLESRREANDAIVHSNKLSFLPMVYHDRTLPETYIADPAGSGVDTLAISTQRVLGLEASPDLASAVGEASRV